MEKFPFNLGNLHFEQVTIEELHKIFNQEAERFEKSESAIGAN